MQNYFKKEKIESMLTLEYYQAIYVYIFISLLLILVQYMSRTACKTKLCEYFGKFLQSRIAFLPFQVFIKVHKSLCNPFFRPPKNADKETHFRILTEPKRPKFSTLFHHYITSSLIMLSYSIMKFGLSTANIKSKVQLK